VAPGHHQGQDQVAPHVAVFRRDDEQRFPRRRPIGVALLLLQVERAVVEAVVIERRSADGAQAAGRDVDEFREVDGAVGGGGVFNQDGRRVVALGVDVVRYICV